MTDEERDRKMTFLDHQAAFIRSHGFDVVMIFANRYEEGSGETNSWVRGDGNWHTRVGLVREDRG